MSRLFVSCPFHTILMKASLTCNLAELLYKRRHHGHSWLQFKQETGRQHFIWHLIQRNKHRITAPGHNCTPLTPTLVTVRLTHKWKMKRVPLGERLKIRKQADTPEDPAGEAEGPQMPSEACGSHR